MSSQNINLFQTKSTLQPLLGEIEQYVKVISVIVLTIVFTGGILVGIAYLVFGQQRDSLEREKEQLLAQVKSNVSKETLFVMIRNRLAAADAIMNSQVSYAPFLDTTMTVIQSHPLSSFSMGEKNSIAISVKVTTLEEATLVLKTVLDMEKNKQISNPVLQSFTMNNGDIQLSLTYTVIL